MNEIDTYPFPFFIAAGLFLGTVVACAVNAVIQWRKNR